MKERLKTKSFMVQGTSSDVGKSAVATGLCRYFARRGKQVAPFKPQNISLNSAVTIEGGEIGRSQAVQARACGLELHTDMNPLLLKPDSSGTVQVIIHGKVQGRYDEASFWSGDRTAMDIVLESYRRLEDRFQLVVAEGSGSPVEVNLRDRDVANMGFAEAVDCPVILVADIDRGGMFAQIIGTLELMSNRERSRVLGFVINRFRGDAGLLQSGIAWLEKKTGKPVFALLPYLEDLFLEDEDSLSLKTGNGNRGRFEIVIPKFPQISNHTDFGPLQFHSGIDLEYRAKPLNAHGADLIILPGSKTVRDDLDWLKRAGWVPYIERHLRYGGKLIGICGGFQMLGKAIHDPCGTEGTPGSSPALGLLEMETTLHPEKKVKLFEGNLCMKGASVKGYEIHVGVSTGKALAKPLLSFPGGTDGAVSNDGQIAGTYVHGLFDLPEACSALLEWAGFCCKEAISYAVVQENSIELMADSIEKNFKIDLFEKKLSEWSL